VEDKAIRGIPWTVASYAGTKAITVGTTIVLARLLVPADFGLVAIAGLVTALFIQFGDLGIGGALILHQDLDDRAKGTYLTLMIAFGALLGGGLAALAPLLADFFRDDRLTAILQVLSATVLLRSVVWFYETALQRDLEFKRRFAALLAESVSYALIAILLAALGAGVWSIVVGQVASVLVLSLTLLLVVPHRIWPRFNPDDARRALTTGGGFLAQGGLSYLQFNIDYMAIGRVLGAAQAGFYSLAFRMSELPYWAISDPVARVTFPGFARMRHRGEDVRPAFLTSLRLVTVAACPLGVLLSACAEPFTESVFGDKWLPMIGPLAVLGIWAAVRPIESTTGWLLNSLGRQRSLAIASALVIAPLLPALFFAADAGGITAVAWLMLGAMVALAAACAVLARRHAEIPLRDQWSALRPAVTGCVAGWLVARGAVEVLGALPPWPTLILSAGAGLVAYLAAVNFVDARVLRGAFGQLGRVLGSERSMGLEAEPPVGEGPGVISEP
jgi:lipopolysaccharide exporter